MNDKIILCMIFVDYMMERAYLELYALIWFNYSPASYAPACIFSTLRDLPRPSMLNADSPHHSKKLTPIALSSTLKSLTTSITSRVVAKFLIFSSDTFHW